MFDIGFWEMVLVGVVALLVFGPERLPRVARETALWVRKARSMVAAVKQDIDHELQLHELQESLRKEKKALSSTIRLDECLSAPRDKDPEHPGRDISPDSSEGTEGGRGQ